MAVSVIEASCEIGGVNEASREIAFSNIVVSVIVASGETGSSGTIRGVGGLDHLVLLRALLPLPGM